jgi:acyl-CoA thioesterase-1
MWDGRHVNTFYTVMSNMLITLCSGSRVGCWVNGESSQATRLPLQASTFFAALALAIMTTSASAAPARIVAYGDSGVAGKGVSPNESYPAQLERMLRDKGHEVTVTNLGVNGRTSQDAVANLETVPRNTDVAIVQFGINDVKHGMPLAEVQKNIDTVVARLRERGAGVLVVGSGTVDLSQVAAKRGALYVNWGGLPDARYHVPGDPNGHFNAAGLRVMAERMLPAVEKLLRK